MNKQWNTRAGESNNRRRLLTLVAILALVFAAMGTNAASAATSSVPFKASVSGTVTQIGPTTFTLAGTGNDLIASHLGKIGYAGNVVITTINSDGVINDTLTETLTAANGDTLTLLCQQVATPISPGVYHGVDQWTVIGGTGCFSGATGSGTGDTHVDLNAGTFTKQSTGTITY